MYSHKMIKHTTAYIGYHQHYLSLSSTNTSDYKNMNIFYDCKRANCEPSVIPVNHLSRTVISYNQQFYFRTIFLKLTILFQNQITLVLRKASKKAETMTKNVLMSNIAREIQLIIQKHLIPRNITWAPKQSGPKIELSAVRPVLK